MHAADRAGRTRGALRWEGEGKRGGGKRALSARERSNLGRAGRAAQAKRASQVDARAAPAARHGRFAGFGARGVGWSGRAEGVCFSRGLSLFTRYFPSERNAGSRSPRHTHTQHTASARPAPPAGARGAQGTPSPALALTTHVNCEEKPLPTMPDRVAELETQLATLQAEVRGRQGCGNGAHEKTRPDSPSRAGIVATSPHTRSPSRHPSPPSLFRLKLPPSTQSARRRCVGSEGGKRERDAMWSSRARPPPKPSPHTRPRGAAAPAWRGRLAGCALQAGNGVWARTAAPTAAAPP